MHLFSALCQLPVALTLIQTSSARSLHQGLGGNVATVVERQEGVQPGPAQSQNISSTGPSLSDSGRSMIRVGTDANITTMSIPGFSNQPGDVDDTQVVCTNITTRRANRCWNELNLTQWVTDWTKNHTCYEEEGFSTCFLRQNGFPGLDCSQISPDACTAPRYSYTVNLVKNPKVFYVAYNIYGMG